MSAPATAAPHTRLNRTALLSAAWLLCLLAAFFAFKAVQTRVPGPADVRSDVLAVETVDMLVLERNNQLIGPALFLAAPKPSDLQHSRWDGDATTVLFHDDLKLSQAELDALDRLTPTLFEVLTLNGQAIGLSHDGQELWSLETFQARARRARALRWALAAVALLTAAAAALWGWRLPRRVSAPLPPSTGVTEA